MSGPIVPLHRNRDFILLWSGQTVSSLGTQVSAIAFPLLVLALTHSPAKAGLVGFFGMLPNLLFQLPAGALVDRWDRKRTMIVADLLRAVVLASIPLALAIGHLTLLQILVAAFIEGSGAVFFRLSEMSALPRVVASAQLPTAIARNEARTRGAEIAGGPIGGALFGIHQALPFLTDAISYVASVVSLLFIRGQFQEERAAAERHLFREIGAGIAWLWSHRFLRTMAVLVAGSNLIFQALVLTVIVLARDKGAPPALIGVMMGLVGVGGLLGSVVAPWLLRYVPEKLVFMGLNWLSAILIPVMIIAPNAIELGLIFGAMAFVGPLWNVLVGTYRLRLVPDQLLGRVQGAMLVLAWGAIPFGSLAAGVLLQSAGSTRTVLVLAAAMLALAIVGTVSPAVRDAPTIRDASAT